jgi:hypothetical protein
MNVSALRIGGKVGQWRELGFEVEDGVAMVGAIRIELVADAEQGKIASWALDGANVPTSLDGLPTGTAARGGSGVRHPNGVLAIDHLVVFTPSLERTTAAFADIGVECRRVREAGGGARQGFFLVGDLLVEVVDGAGLEPGEPARFWGITAVVEDIDGAAAVLGDRVGEIKDAAQPGRRIATVRSEAAGGLPLALITQRR